jgi:Coenzyme PQQ synthesis protein D (PqqD)
MLLDAGGRGLQEGGLMNLPKRRRDDVLSTRLDDDVVVYDPDSKQAHSLNRLAVAVWNYADGSKTIDDLQRLASHELGTSIDKAAVELALRKLEEANLLTEKPGVTSAVTRRQMLKKAGQLGAGAVMTPLVASTLVPMAAAAASPAACTTPFACGISRTFCQTPFCSLFSRLACICVGTTEGTVRCANTCIACGVAKPCASSADCATVGPDAFCWQTSCCGNICVVPCGESFAPSTVAPGTTPQDPLGVH